MRVFMDTEFLELSTGPRFISAGFVTDKGHELYSEVDVVEVESVLAAVPSEFVRQHVVRQLGLWPGVRWDDLPEALAAWFDSLGVDDVEVVYDFSYDFLLVEQLLEVCGVPVKTRIHPAHVGYLLDDEGGKEAAQAGWDAVKLLRGLERHHALADAFALRSRFEAVHPPTPAHQESRTIEIHGTVSVVIEEFEMVKVDSDDGELTLSVGKHTQGVDWTVLQVGQRLRCVVELVPTKVLFAEALPLLAPKGTSPDGR